MPRMLCRLQFLIRLTIEPGKELLGAVIRVHDNGDTISRGNGSDEESGSGGTSDGSLLVAVGKTLAGKVGSTTLRDLEDQGGLGITGSLKSRNGDRGALLQKQKRQFREAAEIKKISETRHIGSE